MKLGMLLVRNGIMIGRLRCFKLSNEARSPSDRARDGDDDGSNPFVDTIRNATKGITVFIIVIFSLPRVDE
jgi:hypothetical protein